MTNKPKEIFIKNKYREMQNKINHNREYMTEHERLNAAPERYDVADDFAYVKRRPISIDRKSPQQTDTADFSPPPTKRLRSSVVSGHNHDSLWLDDPNYNPNDEQISYDSIPDPPKKVIVQNTDQRDLVQETEDDYKSNANIDDISDGNYFVVVQDTIVAESPNLDDMEGFVERLIFSDQVALEDIVVLRKMKLKMGISVGT